MEFGRTYKQSISAIAWEYGPIALGAFCVSILVIIYSLLLCFRVLNLLLLHPQYRPHEWDNAACPNLASVGTFSCSTGGQIRVGTTAVSHIIVRIGVS